MNFPLHMNLLRTLATVSSLTMVSRVLGYVRDFFIARVFGAGPATDAFFVAFKLPNLLRRLFAEGRSRRLSCRSGRAQAGRAEAKRLIDAVATVLFLVLVVTAALGVAAAPILVYVTAPGFALDPSRSRSPSPCCASPSRTSRSSRSCRCRRES